MSSKTLSNVRRAFNLLGLGVVLFAGCDSSLTLGLFGSGDNGGSAPTGGLRLLVTDKPFPVEFLTSATVTLTRIEVRQSSEGTDSNDQGDDSGDEGEASKNVGQGGNGNGNGNGNNDANDDEGSDDDPATTQPATTQPDDEGDDDGQFVTIFEGEKTVDLLQLRNGQMDLLTDVVVPAGHYDQMRLFVTNGHVTLTDGREFDLKVPSGEQSGIKLNFEFDVAETTNTEGATDTQTVLLLDVDLSRAFSAIPSGHVDDVSQINSFQFHPSFAMRLINLLQAGQISGVVTDDTSNPLASVQVSVSNGVEEVTSTVSEADGSFTLVGLPPGTYELEFTKTGYQAASLFDVQVTASTTTDVGVVVLLPGE